MGLIDSVVKTAFSVGGKLLGSAFGGDDGGSSQSSNSPGLMAPQVGFNAMLQPKDSGQVFVAPTSERKLMQENSGYMKDMSTDPNAYLKQWLEMLENF